MTALLILRFWLSFVIVCHGLNIRFEKREAACGWCGGECGTCCEVYLIRRAG